jgi:pimeloyl-ACP methyl ester carboxylesterase/predicted glycosyltransferase
MRALEPTASGRVANPDDGVSIAWEAFGTAGPTVMLLPTWMIVNARQWKFQIPHLARQHRVITFDPRGNGASDRPRAREAHSFDRFARDAIEVLDACECERATMVGNSAGGVTAMTLASDVPARVDSLVLIAPGLHSLGAAPARVMPPFSARIESPTGWELFTRAAWRDHYEEFVRFFFGECLCEPHSTKAWDDCVGWSLETDGETLAASNEGRDWIDDPSSVLERARRIRCPTLFIHGTEDRIVWIEAGRRAAEVMNDVRFTELEGSGHLPHVRDPVAVNRIIDQFLAEVYPRPRREHVWVREASRAHKVLYVSSPIGLGHVRRDIAIADELVKIAPDTQIHWLAQHPVTTVLEGEGHTIHPASRWLASESAHITEQACEHDLHAFQALREMDEIFVANFHTFQQVLEDDDYDLVIADEAWDIDYYWFENPELKRAPLVWMTDFVGYVPMPSGGEREAYVAADYNAEMIEHVARHPRMRDRAIFVGDPDDIVPCAFGRDLPDIRGWTEANFDFAGYISGFDVADLGDRDELRHSLGFGPDETVCVVAVGGSGVGGSLIHRAVEAFPSVQAAISSLRMLVVCGPRIDPERIPRREGIDVVGFVPRLYRQLAACDIALVQGGLTTTMELVASRRPFVYAPLTNHFEQQFHVRHRLDRYRAGRCIDASSVTPDEIANALRQELVRTIDFRPVDTGGAKRAAASIAALLG